MQKKITKPIVYVDMDGVIADFDKNVHLLGERDPARGECACPPEYFFDLDLFEGAQEALHELSKHYEVYILSTPQWKNVLSWTEKVRWIQKHFSELLHKRLILSHDKTLLKGDYLIDDRIQDGAFGTFEGEHIHFGSDKFPDWKAVLNYLTPREKRFIKVV